jgi:hypothetical protein
MYVRGYYYTAFVTRFRPSPWSDLHPTRPHSTKTMPLFANFRAVGLAKLWGEKEGRKKEESSLWCWLRCIECKQKGAKIVSILPLCLCLTSNLNLSILDLLRDYLSKKSRECIMHSIFEFIWSNRELSSPFLSILRFLFLVAIFSNVLPCVS